MIPSSRRFPVQDYGPAGLLVGLSDRADEAAFQCGVRLRERLAAAKLSGVVEVVPAFTTLLVVFDSRQARETARPALQRLLSGLATDDSDAPGVPAGPAREVEIPVVYRGPDLPRVAGLAGLSEEEVVRLHVGGRYRVHCLGFAPGFPYLGGLDSRLHTPRLSSPRPRIPAGSVAIGGEHAGIYPIASPGGWNLIGWTPTRLFCPESDNLAGMFRLQAGDWVRFRRLPGESTGPEESGLSTGAEGGDDREGGGRPCLKVLAPGLGTARQDGGRPGYARFGVAPGGWMDPTAAGWANRLLDNEPGAPVLELCLCGQEFEVLAHGWLAVTGAGVAGPGSGRRWAAFPVRRGDRFTIQPGPSGVWTYLAVPGGFAGRSVLGSRSVHARAGLGRLARAGDILRRDSAAPFRPPRSTAGRRVLWTEIPDYATPPWLRVWPGPQWAEFARPERERFFAQPWVVSSRSDRVGYRLDGPGLTPPGGQMISEPVLPGSIQVPPDGRPIVTMPDGPTLGGYPKLGLIDPADLPVLAQCRPGQTVRLVPVAG